VNRALGEEGGNAAMSATSSYVQSIRPGQASEMAEQEWVSALLRRAAGADTGRHGIVSTLATADLWRIWRRTEHRTTARDKRTHATTSRELVRRGLLDPTERPGS
jgi:hypothetical protein